MAKVVLTDRMLDIRAKRAAEIKALKKALDKELAEINGAVESFMDDLGVTEYATNHYVWKVTDVAKKTVDNDALKAAGIYENYLKDVSYRTVSSKSL